MKLSHSKYKILQHLLWFPVSLNFSPFFSTPYGLSDDTIHSFISWCNYTLRHSVNQIKVFLLSSQMPSKSFSFLINYFCFTQYLYFSYVYLFFFSFRFLLFLFLLSWSISFLFLFYVFLLFYFSALFVRLTYRVNFGNDVILVNSWSFLWYKLL